MPKRKGLPIHGWIAVDKPVGPTSTQVVGKIRRHLNVAKIGHGGTLDPLASGILPIALGEATKTIQYIQDGIKTYTFTVQWGEQRSTDDFEGEVIATSPVRPTMAQIEAILPRFTGDIDQVPPQFSAIKVDGERAYDIARDGGSVDLAARRVYIESLLVLPSPSGRGERLSEHSELSRIGERHSLTTATKPSGPSLVPLPGGEGQEESQTTFRCICGKGTYIRSLGRDMALALGTVGFISALRRDRVGVLGPENAISLDSLLELDHSAALERALLPVQTVLDGIPALVMNEQEATRLKQGQMLSFVSRPDVERLRKIGLVIDSSSSPVTALAVYNGHPVALVTIDGIDIHPARVLNF